MKSQRIVLSIVLCFTFSNAQAGIVYRSSQTTISVKPPLAGGQDFQTRCGQPGVIKCVGFDSATDIPDGTAYGAKYGIYGAYANPAIKPVLDTQMKSSGNSSLKFIIPSNSGSDSSGSYYTNFSDDLSVQFGENSEFYVQFRQRMTRDYASTAYAGGGGQKQFIIGTGDQPSKVYYSCTMLEVVATNGYYRGFPQMYNSCGATSAHGPYDGFEEPYGAYDFKLQNARPAPYCLYSQGKTNPTTFFQPNGNCFGYVADEWVTYQVKIKTGPRVNDYWDNSYVTLWAAREGKPSELLINWGPYKLNAGSLAENQRYGKVWLTPYNTGKSASVSYPETYTWYDELIISRQKIADPK